MANLRATTVACIVLVMATGLLGEQEKSRRRERHDDPNASRASRLLYSPRSRTAGSVKSADMHTVLRR